MIHSLDNWSLFLMIASCLALYSELVSQVSANTSEDYADVLEFFVSKA